MGIIKVFYQFTEIYLNITLRNDYTRDTTVIGICKPQVWPSIKGIGYTVIYNWGYVINLQWKSYIFTISNEKKSISLVKTRAHLRSIRACVKCRGILLASYSRKDSPYSLVGSVACRFIVFYFINVVLKRYINLFDA